jgi:hypothetical protein
MSITEKCERFWRFKFPLVKRLGLDPEEEGTKIFRNASNYKNISQSALRNIPEGFKPEQTQLWQYYILHDNLVRDLTVTNSDFETQSCTDPLQLQQTSASYCTVYAYVPCRRFPKGAIEGSGATSGLTIVFCDHTFLKTRSATGSCNPTSVQQAASSDLGLSIHSASCDSELCITCYSRRWKGARWWCRQLTWPALF